MKIGREAVRILPDELGNYFSQHITYISRHSIDPDLWRNNPEKYPHEARGHYIDADLYDEYPFVNIPRSWEVLLSTYSEETIERWGTAPWRIKNFYNRLTDEFRAGKWKKARLTASALGHYISDLHMPLHVVENYNGQLTDNEGIHGRWEVDLVDFFLLREIHPKGELIQVSDPLTTAFKIVTDSYPHHFLILSADSLARKTLSPTEREKIGNRTKFILGSDYLEILYSETGDLARIQLELSCIHVASFWYSAWIEAGSPIPDPSR